MTAHTYNAADGHGINLTSARIVLGVLATPGSTSLKAASLIEFSFFMLGLVLKKAATAAASGLEVAALSSCGKCCSMACIRIWLYALQPRNAICDCLKGKTPLNIL